VFVPVPMVIVVDLETIEKQKSKPKIKYIFFIKWSLKVWIKKC